MLGDLIAVENFCINNSYSMFKCNRIHKSDSISSTEAADMYSIICLMIPHKYCIVLISKRAGIISLWGAIRIGIIVGQLLFALWLILFR